ncbi:MAG: NAD-dependent epimerase/dehydratase family protein [Bacteroidales bacterium]|nr:NAD-dependent epimerase/dehydratase family protein [Bacteroidales bacterium]
MVFITGGTGLVGAHLIFDLVQKGTKVRALKRSTSNLAVVEKVFHYYSENADELLQQIEWIEGDILDFYLLDELIQEDEEVYHAAAFVSFNPEDHDQIRQINVEGTHNIVNACIKNKVRKLCYVSSIAALGRGEGGKSTSEEDYRDATYKSSVYSQSKFDAEQEVWRGIAEGLNAVMVNPAVIIGPGDWNKGSSQLIQTVYKGLKFYTKGTNGYVDVRDVSKAMIQLMESEIIAQRYVLSSEDWSYKQLFDSIAKALNVKSPPYYAGPALSGVAWRTLKVLSLFTGKRPLITKETAHNANSFYSYSSKKIIKELDFEFIPLAKSIEDTCWLFMKT